MWYEQSAGLNGVTNELVFAAKAVSDGAADGGFHWVAVGNGTATQTNVLDTTGSHEPLRHAAWRALGQERACSLNKDATVDAEDPSVAAGTLTPGGTTVPWVAWSEKVGVNHAIFVSRLVGGDHFELFNSGQPISNTLNDATRPDITFSGNTPYISWQENVGGQNRTFTGHFEGGATAPVFKLDTPTGIVHPGPGTADLRPPISSTCTANPSNADGGACQAGAVGTPFFLYADGTGPERLFAQAYAPSDIATGTSSAVTVSGATVAGSVNPGGARIKVHFDYGTTTGYGAATPDQAIAVGTAATAFGAALGGLPANTVIHFRAVASSDFGTIVGADQTFTTLKAPPPPPPPPNVRPKVTVVHVPSVVSLRHLGKGKLLALKLKLSEPARVTIRLLYKKRLVRSLTIARKKAGSFTAFLSLHGVARRTYKLTITAKDPQGLQSLSITRTLRVKR